MHMANGADAILIPELPLDGEKMDEFCQMLLTRNHRGASFSIVVVAEGTVLEGKIAELPRPDIPEAGGSTRLGGIANTIGEIIQNTTGLETRVTTLGYVQRGGVPVAYDRSLATAFGVKATELAEKQTYGVMTALRGNRITHVLLDKVQDRVQTVSLNAYRTAEMFFG